MVSICAQTKAFRDFWEHSQRPNTRDSRQRTHNQIFGLFPLLETFVDKQESLLEMAGLYLVPDKLVLAIGGGGHCGGVVAVVRWSSSER